MYAVGVFFTPRGYQVSFAHGGSQTFVDDSMETPEFNHESVLQMMQGLLDFAFEQASSSGWKHDPRLGVQTSGRPTIQTSGRLEVWTSGRSDVGTSGHWDVSTSRRRRLGLFGFGVGFGINIFGKI